MAASASSSDWRRSSSVVVSAPPAVAAACSRRYPARSCPIRRRTMAGESPPSSCVDCGAEPGTRSSGTIKYSARIGEDWTGSDGALRARGGPPILPAGDNWEFRACRFTNTSVRRVVRHSRSWSAPTPQLTMWRARSVDIARSYVSRAFFPPVSPRPNVQRRPAAADVAVPMARARWRGVENGESRSANHDAPPGRPPFAIRHPILSCIRF